MAEFVRCSIPRCKAGAIYRVAFLDDAGRVQARWQRCLAHVPPRSARYTVTVLPHVHRVLACRGVRATSAEILELLNARRHP